MDNEVSRYVKSKFISLANSEMCHVVNFEFTWWV